MQKPVLFVMLEPYADWEAAYASSLLLALGRDRYCVKTVSLTREPIHSLGGMTVLPDYDLASAPAEFAAVVLVGGMSWRTEEALAVRPLVERALQGGKLVAAICDATVFLGAMGALNQARHTSNDLEDLKDWAKEAYTGQANYLPEPAVRDGGLITANGTASLEFARELLLALDVAPADRVEEFYQFYKRGPYEAPMPN